MTGYRTGVHFGGNVSNLRYMDFGYMNYTEQAKTFKAGIGQLPSGNDDSVARVAAG